MLQKALIIVDFQKQWLDENSDYYVGDITSQIEKTNQLIDYCRQNDYKIIFTTHIEPDSDNDFVENTSQVEIIDEIHKLDSDIIIKKNKISPFYQTDLEKELEGVEEIVVSGILTNLCVRSLVQDAYDRDFEITVIKDCCVAFDKVIQDFTFLDLKATREEVAFLNLKEFIIE